MPKKGQKIDYDSRSGRSRYPTRPGNIIRLRRPKVIFNRRLNRKYKKILQEIEKCQASIEQYKRFAGERYLQLKNELQFLQMKARRYSPTQEHTLYFWICNLGKIPKGKPPKCQTVQFVEVFVPVNGDWEFQRNHVVPKVWKEIERRAMNTRLRKFGYDVVGHLRFDHWRTNWKEFYVLLGLK